MAKPLIADIATNQTFQNWLNKTNEVVGIFRTDAITASGSGDTTEGNATLVGNFTATNITATTTLNTDAFAAASVGGTIDVNSPTQFNGSTPICAIFSYASGGQTRYTTGSVSWDVGISGSSFIIDTGTGQDKFNLTSAGTLTVPNIVADTIEVNTIVGATSYTNSDVDTHLNTGTATTGQLLSWTGTDYDWVAAPLTYTGGDGIDVASNGVISMDGDGVLNSVQANSFKLGGAAGASTAAFIDGTVTTGVPSGRLQVTYGGSTDDILVWSPTSVTTAVDLRVTGEISATGDIITAYSASDIALKENLQVIDNALDKVSQVSGYTFNYIDRPEERVSGIVAQEIEKVLPEVVFEHERNNGTYKAVRYDNVIPLLLEAIKELKGKVDDLENRLNSNGN